jgi:cephalosporin hydroxylase
MSATSNFIGKVSRRLQRIPAIRWLGSRAENRLRARRFLGDRQRALERFNKCAAPADYLALSNEILGAHQFAGEIVPFLEFAKSKAPRRVAEIGTAMGGTNFLLTHALPKIEMMVGVDLFVANQSILRAFAQPGQTLHFVSASSYAPATVDQVGRLLGGQPLDVLFIDGDHTYEGARKDFARYRQFVRPGGLIAFHDIVPDYLTRFGRRTGRWAGEVPVLWADLKVHYPHHEFIEDPEQDGLGIGVIEYDPRVVLPSELVS